MRKITVLAAFAVLLLLQHQQPCEGLVLSTIFSSVVGFGKALMFLKGILFAPEKTMDETLALIRDMNTNIQYDLGEIMKTLQDLPSIIDLMNKKDTLESQFANLGRVFEEAVTIKRRVNEGQIEYNNSFYEHFRQNNEGDIEKNIATIQRILTDEQTVFHLRNTFNDKLKTFETVCKTGMSHLQLLDTLMGNFKVATMQFYVSKYLILSFLELKGQEDYTQVKANLLDDVYKKYKLGVKNFRNIMSDASREFWRCDPPQGFEGAAHNNNPTFAELKAFSQYYLNENNFAKGASCDKKCESIDKLDKCRYDDKLCRATRLCPGKLVGCGTAKYDAWRESYYAKACVNNDKNALNRYKSIVRRAEVSEKYSCKDGQSINLSSDVYSMPLGATYYCNYCQCVCEEAEYYVSFSSQSANYEENKIITGARFQLIDRTLHLQSQEGKLLPNGTVDKDSVRWIPLDTKSKGERLFWWGFRDFSLAKIELPEDEVIVGLQFRYIYDESDLAYKQFGLTVDRRKFDFRSGKVDPKYTSRIEAPYQKDEYKLDNADVPTRAKAVNSPHSTNQHVRLTTTSLEKDGGQSTIPFIDTQDVVPNTLAPLSGVQVFVRGQEGYGGFLALKLSTHDMRNYIVDDLEINRDDLLLQMVSLK